MYEKLFGDIFAPHFMIGENVCAPLISPIVEIEKNTSKIRSKIRKMSPFSLSHETYIWLL